MAMVRLIDMVVIVLSTLRSQENQKIKIQLSPKNCQKLGIHLILMLKKPAQAL